MGTNVIQRQGGLIPIVLTNLMITIAATVPHVLLKIRRTISSQQDDNCPAGVKGTGNVNVDGNNFGNNNVGDDLYRGVEETCSVPPSGRALDMASTCATPVSLLHHARCDNDAFEEPVAFALPHPFPRHRINSEVAARHPVQIAAPGVTGRHSRCRCRYSSSRVWII